MKNEKIYILLFISAMFIGGIVMLVQSYSGEPLVFPPNISIIFPVNNTNYFTTTLDLNWTNNESLINFSYSLDGNNNVSLSSYCLQESANQPVCGSNGQGKYGLNYSNLAPVNPLNWNDSNYETFTGVNTGNTFFFINYSKPIQAISGLWQLKKSNDSNENTFFLNFTIPNTCFNQNPIQFQIQVLSSLGISKSNSSCYDGTTWNILNSCSDTGGCGLIYEESIWWYPYPKNISLTNLSEGKHNITIYGNNSNGNIGQSSYVYFTINQTPQWSNNQTNVTSNTQLNDIIQLNITLTDNYNLSSYILSWNISGFWLNFTTINYNLTTTNITVIENRTINQSSSKRKAWTVYFNDSIGNKNQTDIFTFNIKNLLPNATNISITPLPLTAGTNAKGHANYSDSDGDSAGGNQTYWYVNKTLILEANNSFTLLGGNVTELSNITFSARFNDTYDWSSWVNSSTITVGDSTPPVIFGNSTQGKTSFTTSEMVNITVNVTDAAGVIDLVKVVMNRTGTSEITNNTMTKLDGNLYQYATTYAIDTFDIVSFYARDGSQNVNIVKSTLSFTVTSPPSSEGTSGGGGGTSIILKIENQNQTSLFFGFTTFSFFVISTPSEQVKLIKFKNIGNATFMDANVKVLGNANKFISASVCSINQTEICKTENINILAGENKFLRLDANFTSELGMGSEGIIRLESLANSEQEGKIVDLLLSIDRPPAYRYLIKPISNLSPYRQFIGNNEIPALIAGYGLFVLTFVFGISIIKGVL